MSRQESLPSTSTPTGSVPSIPDAVGPRAASLGVFFVSLLVYLLTLAPTVTGEDSGELVAAAATLGIPHPPGYPLWCIVAYVFTWFPVGDVAWRVNLASAVMAAAACGLTVPLLARLGVRPLLGAAAALLMAFSSALWSQSVIAEVYALALLTLVGIIYTLVLWRDSRDDRMLYLAGLLCGLSVGVHNTVLLMSPLLLAWLAWVGRRDLLQPRRLLATLAATGLGLAVHLYLPLRAKAQPAMNWGNPDNWERFWAHVTRAQYPPVLQNRTVGDFLEQVRATLGFLLAQWPAPVTVLVVAVAVVGMVALWRRDRFLALWFGSLLAVLTLGFVLILNYRGEQESLHVAKVFFIPAWYVLVLLAAQGLEFLAGGSQGEAVPTARRLVPALALVAVVVSMAFTWRSTTMSGNNVARRYGEDLLATVPPQSILFTSADYETFPVAYLQIVEKKRVDVTAVDEQRDLDRVLNSFGRSNDGDPMAALAASATRPVYFTRRLPSREASLQPVGLLFRLVPAVKGPVDWVARRQEGLKLDDAAWKNYRAASSMGPWVKDWSTASILSRYEEGRARSALLRGMREQGIASVRKAAALLPGDPEHQNAMGLLLTSFGEFDSAIEYYQKALVLRPSYPEASYSLVKTFINLGRWDEAQTAYARSQKAGAALGAEGERIERAILQEKAARPRLTSLEEDAQAAPGNAELQFNLARASAQFNHLDRAEAAYRRAIAANPKLAPAWQGLGVVLVQKRDDRGAAQAWTHFLELQPQGPAASEIRDRLKRLRTEP